MLSKEGKDCRFWEVETQRFEGDFEFMVVYSAVFVEVEEAELGGFIIISTYSLQAS